MPFSNKRVLIVDDCQSWLDILDELLSSFGLSVELCQSGLEAIEILKNKSDYFDLVLVDWNMPELDGIETCKKIHDELNIDAKKIILISSYAKESLEEGIKKAHIDNYLHKPVNPSLLNDLLSEIFFGQCNLSKLKEFDDNANLNKKMLSLKGSKILLAEDNQVNREVILDLLEEFGIVIDVALNGEEAIELSKKNDYELILMDIQMPVMDGYEATRQIRLKDKNTPIIALTANAMKEDIEKSKQTGMNAHLNKPIEINKLYETLLKYISVKEELEDKEEVKTEELESSISSLPDFDTLDKDYALNLVMGREKTFIKILKGLFDYKDLDFDGMDDEELKRVMHTIKGLSASAGALDISEMAKEIELTLNRNLLNNFNEKYNLVLDEIDEKLGDKKSDEVKKIEIDNKTKEIIFSNLKDALKSNRVKTIKSSIEEIEKYQLNDKDTTKFYKIKDLVDRFKFKQALEMFSE